MKTLNRFAAIAAIALGVAGTFGASTGALAAAASASNVTVERVGCGASTVSCFIIVPAGVVTSSCATNARLISWDGTTTSGKNITATALTAKAAGLQVNLTYDDAECNGPNPRLIALTLA